MFLFGPPNVGKMREKGDVTGLLKALEYQRDAQVRWQAALALGQLPLVKNYPEAVPVLIKALKDSNPEVRQFAAEALGVMGDPSAGEPLFAALRDNDWSSYKVRWAALYSLEKLGQTGVDLLATVLGDKDHFEKEIREAAANSLKKLGDPRSVRSLLLASQDHDFEVSEAARKALLEIGALHIEPFITALGDSEVLVSANAAWFLGDIQNSQAVEPLVDVLRTNEPAVRRAAARSLGLLTDPRAVDPLLTALPDPDSEAREAMVIALGVLRDLKAEEPLIAALLDSEPVIRVRAAWALGKLGDPRAVAPLIQTLNDDDIEARKMAAWALGMLNDGRAVIPLLHVLEKELEKKTVIGKSYSVMDDFLEQKFRENVVDALASLIDCLMAMDLPTRLKAVEVLAKSDEPSAREPLKKLMHGSEEQVRKSAAAALGKLGPE